MAIRKYNCRDCGAEFEVPKGQSGRPPIRCEACRVKVQKPDKSSDTSKPKLSPTEIVDRLEFNLKAAGLHISQHRNKWE